MSDRAVIVTIKTPSISDEWPRCHCNDENLQLVMSNLAVIVYDENPPSISDEWPRCHCNDKKPSFN